MSEITTIGLDLAKSVFQVRGVNDADGIVTRKRLRRGQMLTFFAGLPPCLVGMEACATAPLSEAHQMPLMRGEQTKGLGARAEGAGT